MTALSQPLSDSAGLLDAQGSLLLLSQSGAELLGLTDSVTATNGAAPLGRSQSDTAGLTDIGRAVGWSAAGTDLLGLSDTLSQTLRPPQTYVIPLSDTVGLSEPVSSLAITDTQIDALGLADSWVATDGLSPLSDDAGLTDATTVTTTPVTPSTVTATRYIFTPPVAYANPTTIPTRHSGNDLFRHSHPRQTGIANVYLLPGGVVSTDDRNAFSALATFHGGHICDVTASQAAVLRAAGYTVLELAALPSDPTPVDVPPVTTPPVVTPPIVLTVPGAPVLSASTPTVPSHPDLTATLLSDPVAPAVVPTVPTAAPTALAVAGANLVDANGARVMLRGANIASGEYMPVQDFGGGTTFYEAHVPAAIDDVARWGGNCVRLPHNSAAWLGLLQSSRPGVADTVQGTPYQAAMKALVDNARARGMYVIVELHWNDPRTTIPSAQQWAQQQPMLDRAHALDFWSSAASFYQYDTGIIFDLYNEPYAPSGQPGVDQTRWQRWRDGGDTITTVQSNSSIGGNTDPISYTWTTAGMQEAVTAVRNAGARNVILLGGLQYANAVGSSQTDPTATGNGLYYWRPNDPLGQLAASVHVYPFNSFGPTAPVTSSQTTTFSAASMAPILALAQQMPVVLGEFGDPDTANPPVFSSGLVPWAEQHLAGHLAWTWNTYTGQPALITAPKSSSAPYDPVLTPVGSQYGTFIRARRSIDVPNPVISRTVPVTATAGSPAGATDGTWDGQGSYWQAPGYPATLTWDLTGVPAASRTKLALSWANAFTTNLEDPAGTYNLPGAYTIQAASSASGPWTTVATVTGNLSKSRMHTWHNAPSAAGTPWTWLQVVFTAGASSNTTGAIGLALSTIEVADVSGGGFDTWAFLAGDSITAVGTNSATGAAQRIATYRPTGWTPLVQTGGMSGRFAVDFASGGSLASALDGWLAATPARNVPVGLGSNDAGSGATPSTTPAAYEAAVRNIINRILAAGKKPWLATIPFSTDTTRNANVQALNARLTAVRADYGSSLGVGPELYAFYAANPSQISGDTLHPTTTGYASWNDLWAQVMDKAYPGSSRAGFTPPTVSTWPTT